VDLLSAGDGPWTVFGPTDDAFAALPEEAGKFTTPEWHGHLTDILTYHVIAGKIMSSDLSLDQRVGMANGGDTTITSLGPPPMINTASIDPADVEATNGVVHVIDEVLLPTSATKNIVDIVTSPAGASFSTLVEAVTAAGLVETLAGEGPFTVFAPTNEAFGAVDATVLEYLLSEDGKGDLVNVLTYHVFPGVVYQSDVAAGSITMVNQDTATISVDPIKIQDANIAAGQILASNGVIHLIDKVILPPSLALPDLSAPKEPEGMEESGPEEPEGMEESGAVYMGSTMAVLLSAAVAFLRAK